MGEQEDGKLFFTTAVATGATFGTGIMRFLPNGARDPTFTPLTLSNFDSTLQAFQQPSNRWVVVQTPSDGLLKSGDIFRIESDGSIDSKFKPADWMAHFEGSSHVYLGVVAVQPNGQIVLPLYDDTARPDPIVRINLDGSRDESFAISNAASWLHSILVQTDGRILMARNANSNPPTVILARYHPDGRPDDSFRPRFGPGDTLEQMVLEANGTVLLAGSFPSIIGKPDLVIVRMIQDGAIDSTFGPIYPDWSWRIVSLASGQILQFNENGQISCFDSTGAFKREMRPEFPARDYFVLGDGRLLVFAIGAFDQTTPVRLDLSDPDRPGVEFRNDRGEGTIRSGEGQAEGIGAFSKRIGRVGDTSKPLPVIFSTRDGTARAGDDFVAQDMSITFQPLETVKTVNVELLDDEKPEGFEDFALVVTIPATNAEGLFRIRIVDDDPGTVLKNPILRSDGAFEVFFNEPIGDGKWQFEVSSDLKTWVAGRVPTEQDRLTGDFKGVDFEGDRASARFYRLIRSAP